MYCFTAAHLNCSVGIINSRPGYSLWAPCLSFSFSLLLEVSSSFGGGVKLSMAFIDLYIHTGRSWCIRNRRSSGAGRILCAVSKSKKVLLQIEAKLNSYSTQQTKTVSAFLPLVKDAMFSWNFDFQLHKWSRNNKPFASYFAFLKPSKQKIRTVVQRYCLVGSWDRRWLKHTV